ncbi:MAG: GIY-YIG nuclease family protein [Patescibacteria group bacterium]|nr:GIY-YIG nuclease family protein [Patescibacteria group bacterium]
MEDRPATSRAGIYEISDPSGRRYVGASVDMAARWTQHRALLRQGAHHNKRLQDAWNRYGEDAMRFRVVEAVANPDELWAAEQVAIDRLKPEHNEMRRSGHTVRSERSVKLQRAIKWELRVLETLKQGLLEEETEIQMRRMVSTMERAKREGRVEELPFDVDKRIRELRCTLYAQNPFIEPGWRDPWFAEMPCLSYVGMIGDETFDKMLTSCDNLFQNDKDISPPK